MQEWALNCATMSQYHLSRHSYRLCCHCLGRLLAHDTAGPTNNRSSAVTRCPAAALMHTLTISAAAATIVGRSAPDGQDDKEEKLAEVARCWVKLYIELLTVRQ